MEKQERDIEKLSPSDRMFIIGFDSAVKVFNNTINNLESSEISGSSVRCFQEATDDTKAFIKKYISEELEAFRGYVIAEMTVGHGENE